MAKEEFLSSQESLKKEIDELSALQSDKRKELNQLRNDWCNELCKQYADYIGKMVKIVFKYKDVEETKVVDGFLFGFSCKKHGLASAFCGAMVLFLGLLIGYATIKGEDNHNNSI